MQSAFNGVGNLTKNIKPMQGTQKVQRSLNVGSLSSITGFGNLTEKQVKNGAVLSKTYVNVANGIKTTTRVTKDAIVQTEKYANAQDKLNDTLKKFKPAAVFSLLTGIYSKIMPKVLDASDYISSWNLFNTVMGKSKDTAREFVKTFSNGLGLDQADIMRYISNFKSLTDSFGMTEEASYTMSKNLTQLSYDLSAFKGISVEDAMQKLKSGIAGEIEPMRAIGIALDEASLQEVAYANGIKQRVNTMTRAQKTELLYYQIMHKTAQAQGYFGKTLLTPQTALVQIKAQFTQLSRAIGNIFIPILMAAIPYVKAITQVLTEAAQAIAAFFGFKLENFEIASSTFENISGGIGDIGDAAGKATKKLNGMLAPFDELNTIDFGKGGGGSGGAGGVGGSLGLPLYDYDALKDALDTTSEKVEKIKRFFNEIKDYVIVIGGALLTWKIGSSVITFLSNLGLIKNLSNALLGLAGAISLVAGSVLAILSVKSILEGDLSLSNLLKGYIGGALAGIGAGILFGGPVGWTVGIAIAFIVTVTWAFKKDQEMIHQFAEAEGIDYDGMSLSQKLLYRLDLSLQIYGLKEGDNPIAKKMNELLVEAKNKVKEKLKEIGTNIQKWFEELPGKIGYWLGLALGAVIKFLFVTLPAEYFKWKAEVERKVIDFFTKDLIGWIVNNWETIKQWAMKSPLELGINIIKGLWEGISSQLSGLWRDLKNFITGFINGFKEGLGIHSPSTVFKDIGINIFQGLLNGLSSMWNTIKTKVTGWVDEIKGKFNFSGIKLKLPHISWQSGGVSASGTLKKILETLNLPTSLPKLNVSWYAGGGMPEMGELFFAGEAGPEWVGSIGNQTAVANQDQMTNILMQAAYEGMSKALSEKSQLSKTDVYIGNEKVYSGYGEYQNNQNNKYGTNVVRV